MNHFANILALAIAAAVPSPSASPVSSAAGADSIKILSCSLEYNSRDGLAAKMHVDFMNLNALPVTHIRFRVQAGLSEFAVMDLGTFAPNVKIHHDLDPPMTNVAIVRGVPIPGADGLYCGIDAYTLSDGYMWISPHLQAELQGQQNAH